MYTIIRFRKSGVWLIARKIMHFRLLLYMPMEISDGRSCGIFGMIWNKFAVLWFRFGGMILLYDCGRS